MSPVFEKSQPDSQAKKEKGYNESSLMFPSQFLYKDESGRLVFKDFVVTVYDEDDPSVEDLLSGSYKNYIMEYKSAPVFFTLFSKGGIFGRKYVIEKLVYYDGIHLFMLEESVSGKSAKVFAENLAKILQNPKNVYLLPYLQYVGPEVNVGNIPYRAYYYDEQYILGHGTYEVLFIVKDRSYLETYACDMEIRMGFSNVTSLFNAIFECKEHKCLLSSYPDMIRILKTKKIMSRELYDILQYDKVLGLIHEDDSYYFLVHLSDGKFMRYYTNPDTEIIFRIEHDNDPSVNTDVEIKYYDFLDMLKNDHLPRT